MNERPTIQGMECYIKKDGKYLMLRRHADKKMLPNVWMAPGGKREHNEGLFATTRREIKEETGLEIKNLRIIATGVGYLRDINSEVYWHFLEADYASGEVVGDPNDGELSWYTKEELLELPNLLSELKHVLPVVLGTNVPVMSYKVVYSEGNNLESIEIEKA